MLDQEKDPSLINCAANSDDAEAHIFYLKMKGDYLRYEAEVADEGRRKGTSACRDAFGKNSWMNIVIYAYVVIFEIKSLNYCSLLILHIHSLTVCDKYLPCFTCSSST